MIDWHSHILPAMDDGCRDVTESLAVLRLQAQQGVTTVVATPHFYANRDSVASFLERRTQRLAQLNEQIGSDCPHIRLGAEVRYYAGISRMPELKQLMIEGTKLLLLEMPENHWSETTVREVLSMSGRSGMQIILAHVERCRDMQHPRVWDELHENGIRMQVNADYFQAWRTRRKAMSMLKQGEIHFIGSDCHNMTTRPPQIGPAYDRIRRRFGEDYVAQMDAYGYSLLSKTN